MYRFAGGPLEPLGHPAVLMRRSARHRAGGEIRTPLREQPGYSRPRLSNVGAPAGYPHQGSNLGHPPCDSGALPLSYAGVYLETLRRPGSNRDLDG